MVQNLHTIIGVREDLIIEMSEKIGKILEKIVFDDFYSFLNNNRLISSNQSGFRPGYSTINQLISITSTIFESFDFPYFQAKM